MEAVSATDANKFYAATRFIFQLNQMCYDKCVIDFQTKDLSAMEKECALACLKKQLNIYKDIVDQKWYFSWFFIKAGLQGLS